MKYFVQFTSKKAENQLQLLWVLIENGQKICK